MLSRQFRRASDVEPRLFARHLLKNPPPGSSLPKAASSGGFPCGELMRACWAATLLVLVPPSPASCATCTGTSVVPRVLALTHRHRHKSPCVRQPFAGISGNTAFSSLWFLSRKLCPIFVCHFKGSLHVVRPCLAKRFPVSRGCARVIPLRQAISMRRQSAP